MPRTIGTRSGLAHEFDSTLDIVKRVCHEIDVLAKEKETCKNDMLDFAEKTKQKAVELSDKDEQMVKLHQDLHQSLDLTVVAIAGLRLRCPLPNNAPVLMGQEDDT